MKLLIGGAGIVLLLRLALSGIFLLAALPKLQDPAGFAADITAYQVTGANLSAWVAILLPWTELACSLGLLAPWTRRASGLIFCLMLVAFIGLHLSASIRGLDIACGCFGKEAGEIETNYLWLLTRNSLLLAAASFITFEDFRNKPERPVA